MGEPAYQIVGRASLDDATRAFVRRRIEPFLDRSGVNTRTPVDLLSEAYIQGIRDTLDAQGRLS